MGRRVSPISSLPHNKRRASPLTLSPPHSNSASLVDKNIASLPPQYTLLCLVPWRSWHRSADSSPMVIVVSAGTAASLILAQKPLASAATTPSETPVKQVRLPAEIRPLPCVSHCGVDGRCMLVWTRTDVPGSFFAYLQVSALVGLRQSSVMGRSSTVTSLFRHEPAQ